MMIKSVRCIQHVQTIDAPGWSLITGRVAQAPCVIVLVEGEDGTIGYGTVSALQPFALPMGAVTACVDYLGSILSGQLLNINARMRDLDRALMGCKEIKSAFEVALHDLAATHRGVSLSELLGGRLHEKIPVMRLVSLQSPEKMADAASGLVAGGYQALKLKLSGERELDVARVRAVRERLGAGVHLTVDANGRYEVKSAIRAIEEMDEHGVALVEQPVPRGNREGMALITRTVRPMVEADESAMNFEEIVDLVRDRVADCINLRISRLGGIRGAMDAARVCEAGDIKYRFGLMLLPSHFSAVTLHVAAMLPHVPVGHEIGEHELYRDDLFEPLPIVNGMAAVPNAPGVGVRLKAMHA